MIHPALRALALCGLAVSTTFAHDATSTSGVQAATTWIAQPSAASVMSETTPESADDETPDDLGLFTVTEPATLAMFAAGLLGIVGIGHRRRRG